MNWIYDARTLHSRLMVGYDRWGITIRQWSDDCVENGYRFEEGFFTWKQYKTRERSYSMDDDSGKLKTRIVNGAISLMAYWGGSSDSCGDVPTLDRYLNGHQEFYC